MDKVAHAKYPPTPDTVFAESHLVNRRWGCNLVTLRDVTKELLNVPQSLKEDTFLYMSPLAWDGYATWPHKQMLFSGRPGRSGCGVTNAVPAVARKFVSRQA